MTKAALPAMPAFFDRYINLAPDFDLLDALRQTATIDNLIDRNTLDALGDQRYAPGKWTMRDIVQHLIDTERIMTYRALRIARADQTPLPGFDENSFAELADASHRSLADLCTEYAELRRSTLQLFGSFTNEMLLRSGTASDKTISVLALGFVLVGHPMHHANIVRERYVPLLG